MNSALRSADLLKGRVIDLRRQRQLHSLQTHGRIISFGWGNATVSLQTKKIKGLHENDFIMATKIDRNIRAHGPGVNEL
jgi:Pterin 4 alpha carbinolamine dehydratase